MTANTRLLLFKVPPLRCAPWCGSGCTEAQYQRALDIGREIATSLGPGWTAQPMENMGWHLRVEHTSGLLILHISHHELGRNESYAVEFDVPGVKQWWATGRTPRSAVRQVLQMARDHVAAGQAALDTVKGAVQP